jgi:hypothetical protein
MSRNKIFVDDTTRVARGFIIAMREAILRFRVIRLRLRLRFNVTNKANIIGSNIGVMYLYLLDSQIKTML